MIVTETEGSYWWREFRRVQAENVVLRENIQSLKHFEFVKDETPEETLARFARRVGHLIGGW